MIEFERDQPLKVRCRKPWWVLPCAILGHKYRLQWNAAYTCRRCRMTVGWDSLKVWAKL